AAGAFSIFFMKQFFETLPDELSEAARIDGCSEFKIFWKIYMPLAKTALATLGIMTFQAGWNQFMWPLIV
ncbi:carbohydrate ABC transporter permease, partial [Escherichia coli]|nr:carbohydrate ABC transporter permease [Escherichia coli]